MSVADGRCPEVHSEMGRCLLRAHDGEVHVGHDANGDAISWRHDPVVGIVEHDAEAGEPLRVRLEMRTPNLQQRVERLEARVQRIVELLQVDA